MVDHLTKDRRSWNMSRIRSRNTKPEMTVRSTLHKLGFRFRLNNKKLPGKPDLTLKKHKTVVFVHGCFWHRCKKCKRATTPKTNVDYWIKKFQRNVARDEENYIQLTKLGWKVIVVWECEAKDKDLIKEKFRGLIN